MSCTYLAHHELESVLIIIIITGDAASVVVVFTKNHMLMQEEQEAKAEEEQFPDPAAQERKRSEEAEKWRLHQLQAGASSEDNANFQVGFRLCVLIRQHLTQQLPWRQWSEIFPTCSNA